MSSKYPRQPVSEEVFPKVYERLLRRAHLKQGGVLDVRKGTGANELIMVTVEGEVPCRVTEDDEFIIFEMPFGKNDRCAPKREFLEVLSGDSGGQPATGCFPDGEMPADG